jgi:hypothetical protein
VNKQIITDPDRPPVWLTRATKFRSSTKSAQARRRARQARNQYLPKGGGNAPAPFGKEKFVRSSRFGAALARGGHSRSILKGKGIDEQGNVVTLPRKQKSYDLSGMKVAELRDLASRRGLKGLYTAKKAALIAAIERSRY